MKHSQEKGQPERRSAQLARTKARVNNSGEFGSIRLEEAHFRSGSEGEEIIVGQVEVIVTPGPDQATPAEPEVQEEKRRASADELSSDESDIMPSMTRLKYSRFKETEARMWTIGSRNSNPQPSPTKKNRLQSSGFFNGS